MEKEKLEGISLQVSAIFARLDALKQALPKESLKEYLHLIVQKKQSLRAKYDVNENQLQEWLQ